MCVDNKKLDTESFIKKAREVHGDKYDYSKVEYKNKKTKVCIICPIHGDFWQLPGNHTNQRNGCPMCVGDQKSDAERYIKKVREVHGDKYDYSKVEYKHKKTK